MAISSRELEKETKIFWSPGCGAGKITWQIGAVDVIGEPEEDGCGFKQTGDKLISADEMPTEFFNHQLMDCDPHDFEALREFVSTWGLPYSPYRYGSFGYYSDKNRRVKRQVNEARKEAKTAMEATDALIERGESSSLEERVHAVISQAEAISAVSTLQRVVIEVRKAAEGDPLAEYAAAILNAASCNSLLVGRAHGQTVTTKESLEPGEYWITERLTRSICNQIVDAIADPAPWRLCACEGCGVIFKHKQSAFPDKRGTAKYCCQKCTNRQAQRNRRRAANNRIDHGL